MRYEDASNAGAFQGSEPIANDDMDSLPAGAKTPATGNLISGEGTQTGSAGADSAAGAHVTAIAGKGGEDTSFSGGKLSVSGEHGKLSVDGEGNYSYLANQGVENVRDRFTYTLADNQGNSDTAALIVEIGKTPVVIKANAQQIVPGPDGVVTLPPGVQLSDVMVVGRNLVINLPDGTQLIIIDGAVFVPQLVLDGVSIPSTNVAALLIGQEPQPAAGETPPSSGGNFALPPPPLDPGVPLGDLLPPTEYDYIPPEPEEVFDTFDNEPEVGPNPDALLDDDALEGGNPGGTGDDPDSVNASGQLSGSGGDGDLTFEVQLTGAPDGFTYVSGGAGIVLIQQGGVTVLTVTVNPDGSYSVVENNPIDHAAGGDENNVQFTINYTVTDEDGDSAFGTLNINVDDDTPLLTEVVTQGGVTLDESDAGTPAGFPISGNSVLPVIDFNALFGADGAASADSTVFGLVITGGGSSGIQTAVGDFPITLVQIDGDTIEGHYNGSNVAFIIQLEADGTITLTQNVALEHLVDGPPGPAHNDSLDLGGLIAVSVTITDGDGDQASAQVGIGDTLVFLDDGPSAGEGEVTASVDEDELPDGITDGDGETTTATGTLSALVGDFGADGPGSFGWDASALGGLPALTSGGAAVSYAIVGDTLVAYTGGDPNNAANHVFTVELQANGDYEVTLLAQVDHLPNVPANDDDQILTIDLSELVQITDADGDFVNLGEGQFTVDIEDDVPVPVEEPNPVTGQVDEDALVPDGNNDSAAGDDPGGTTDSGAAGSLLSLFNIGADQPGVVVLLTDTSGLPALTSNGVAVTYAVVGDTLTASAGGTDVFTLTVNADGSWEFELLDQLDHPVADTEDNLLLDFSSIIGAEDADGDTSDPLPEGSFVIDVDDDLPVPVEEPNPVTGQVDEDALVPDGNNDSAAGDDPGGTTDSGAAGSLLSLFNIGADQPGVVVLLTDTSGLPSLFSNGVAVTYAVVGDTLTASAGAVDVFTLTVNADGSWEFELLDQLDHPVADTEDNLLLDFSSIIGAEDADGDTSDPLPEGSFVIDVDDDLPVPVEEPNPVTGQVDEDALVPDGNNDSAAGDDPGGTTDSGAAGSLLSLFNIGADQPGVVVLLTDTSGLPALTSNGVAVTYAVVGDTLTASAGGTDVFTLTVNADGSWEFELLDQLDHPVADTEDNLLLDFSSIIGAEDADGDTSDPLPEGSFVIDVDDDLPVPVEEPDPVTGQVDEDALVPDGNNDSAAGDDPGGTTDSGAAGSLLSLFNIGADQPGVVVLLTDTSGLPSLFSNGVAVTYAVVGDTLTASAGGTDVFTLTVNADGSWEFELLDQLDHPVADTEDNLLLDFSSIIGAEDADGDTSDPLPEGSFVIDVDDDLPVPVEEPNPVTGQVDEDALVPDGNNDSAAGDDPGGTTDSGAAGSLLSLFNIGADQPGVVVLLTDTSGLPALTSNGVAVTYAVVGDTLTASAGGTDVFTLTVNADGSWEFELLDQLDHPVADTEDNLLLDFSSIIGAEDADGDTSDPLPEGSFVIDVDDDLPVPVEEPDPVTGQVDEDALVPDGNNDSAAGDDPGGTTDSGAAGSLLSLFNIGADQPGVVVLLTDTSGLPSLFSNGVAVTYAVVGDTLTASAGAVDVFTLTVNADGSWEFELLDQLDHPVADTEDNLLLDFSSIIGAEDADGDTSDPLPEGSFVIDVDDDLPVPVEEPNPVTGQVDEDALVPDGNNDSAAGDDPGGTTDSGAAGSLLSLFNIGADQPGVVVLLTDTSGLPALTSNGVAVTYAVVGDTLTASAGGTDVFTLTVNADGSWEFELLDQLDHPVADTEDNLLLDFSSIIGAEDADGDTSDPLPEGSFVIDVDDDLPVPVEEPNPVTGQVDEDALVPDGNNDSAAGDDPGGTTDSGAAGSLLSLFNIGADQPGVVVLLTDTSGLPALTSNGVAVTYAVVGDTLTASAGGTDVFTLTVNADGSWEFELLDQLDHPVADTEDNLLLDFSSIIGAEDADGDTSDPLPEGSFVIDVDDDLPTAFDPDPITTGVENMAGETATADLDVDGNIDDNVGADQPGVVRFANITNGDDSGFTSGEDPIEYWLSNDGQTLQGRVGSTDGTDGTLIFEIELNQDQGPGDDTYTITMFGTIDNGAGITFDDLTSTAAGNVEVRGVGADDPLTTVDLMLSAGPNPATTVNTDSDSIGAANQSMDVGETIRIDFITNLEDDPADDLGTFPNGFSYDGHVSTNSFIGFIPQVQGSQTETVAFTVYALDTTDTDGDAPDRDPTGGFTNSTITTITEVTVQGFDVGEDTPVSLAVTYTNGTTFVPVAYGISVRVNLDGSVTFSGIQEGDSYGFSTEGAGDFNAVVVESEAAGTGGSSEDSFDLGVFSIGIVDTGDPINLSYDLELTDADGDSVLVTDALQITIAPDTTESLAVPFTAESSESTSSFSLLASDSQDQQVQKSAANSNTLTLAAAVAAAGMGSKAAAFEHQTNDVDRFGGNEHAVSYSAPDQELSAANDDGPAVSTLIADAPASDDASADSSSSSSADSAGAKNVLDDSAASAASEPSQPAAADDQGPDTSAAFSATAPAVGMPSAAALQAADLGGNAQQGGAIEQVLADALGHQAAPTVDALLASLPGGDGNGGLGMIAELASHAAGGVPAWDMGGAGGYDSASPMLFNVHAAMQHQDAVQPAVNG